VSGIKIELRHTFVSGIKDRTETDNVSGIKDRLYSAQGETTKQASNLNQIIVLYLERGLSRNLSTWTQIPCYDIVVRVPFS
jgi:hypothetical protein